MSQRYNVASKCGKPQHQHVGRSETVRRTNKQCLRKVGAHTSACRSKAPTSQSGEERLGVGWPLENIKPAQKELPVRTEIYSVLSYTVSSAARLLGSHKINSFPGSLKRDQEVRTKGSRVHQVGHPVQPMATRSFPRCVLKRYRFNAPIFLSRYRFNAKLSTRSPIFKGLPESCRWRWSAYAIGGIYLQTSMQGESKKYATGT